MICCTGTFSGKRFVSHATSFVEYNYHTLLLNLKLQKNKFWGIYFSETMNIYLF